MTTLPQSPTTPKNNQIDQDTLSDQDGGLNQQAMMRRVASPNLNGTAVKQNQRFNMAVD